MAKKRKHPIVRTATADWKDICGLAATFKEALKAFGLFVCEDPQFEGGDDFGYLISDKPLTKASYRKHLKDIFDAKDDDEYIGLMVDRFDPKTAYKEEEEE